MTNLTSIQGWLAPHSIEWYEQLGKLEGKYLYPWDSFINEPNGESIFDSEAEELSVNQKVLDVGCGEGRFTMHFASFAKEIVGVDASEAFIMEGHRQRMPNVSFINANTKSGLPFANKEFDFAYIRKGPTSAYPLLKKAVKDGGHILGLHPGDSQGRELPGLFPVLFEEKTGTPILKGLENRAENSNFTNATIEEVTSIEYLKSPLDVIKLVCFGQLPSITAFVKEKYGSEIARIFNQYAASRGLAITHSRYIVRAAV
ncbi:class I SAM-dependent methyltransferase [Bacillus infantis]|uniref:Class I SAM-dependent methyltransferase n=1 Tax=Bacillus infantis TaxID=324767 RepID=A0A5D4SRM1_9BACI|nr:class I SAM-dependent methyltransferase [Bacillus infantis]OXT18284.1 SAM-dependent methyltransferase [Bacillus sp. OG2]TYS64868.1 class I SAM-dependent methyltransferase [Bacillus infantis]